MLARAVATVRRAGVTARLLGRADAAFYRHDLVEAMIAHEMWFSITARMNAAVTAAIATVTAAIIMTATTAMMWAICPPEWIKECTA